MQVATKLFFGSLSKEYFLMLSKAPKLKLLRVLHYTTDET